MFQLERVKDLIQSVAYSISMAMDVDIVVIDANKKIIGKSISDKMSYYPSNVAEYIVERKEFVIIEHPGKEDICKGCHHYGCCSELIELDAPIIYQDECLGILSVTAYEEETRNNILKKKDDYREFLISMAGLISSKVGETLINEERSLTMMRIMAIINSVNYGMLAIDEDDKIIYCNQIAESIIETEPEQLIGQKWQEFFHVMEKDGLLSGAGNDRHEVKIYAGSGREKDAYITVSHMHDDSGAAIGMIISIEDVFSINNLVGAVMGYNSRNYYFADIIGETEKICETKERAQMASKTDSTLLIRGESGTGKELFARAVHNASKRSEGAFVTINCAAIPEALLESELFGYEAGAFTGADRRGKPGKFELADKGTIFLDEIGDMPIYLQAKLLRVLQEHSITRIGGLKEKKVDIRIIAATNRNLEKMVEENRFRGDLYYRLNVIPIYVPPLRERKDDIPLLIEFFLGKYRQKLDKHIFGVTGDVRSVLMDYSWPGNIRELENVIEYAMNMEPGNILTMQSLPDDIKSASGGKKQDDRSLKSLMREREREILREKLRQYGDSLEAKKKIADSLGIGIATLYRKLHETSLD